MAPSHELTEAVQRDAVESRLPNRCVCIVQAVMKRYRVPFFKLVSDELAADGIKLEVVYGPPWADEALRGDNVALEPPLGRLVPNWWIFRRLLVQPFLRPWLRSDLVIVEHANKYALNYVLMLLNALGLKRMAYWSHGRDRQANPNAWTERFKRWTLRRTDWWFTYTEGSRKDVEAAGFSGDRITVVGNAIDTRLLRAQLDAVSPDQRRAQRAALGWNGDERIVVYCGSMHPNKCVDALIEASDVMHASDPNVRLLVIGGGPGMPRARELAAKRPWVRCVGPRFGADLAALLSLGELWLNPGLVGLGVLDAFCAGLPMITRDLEVHSPEIEYVEHGVNGLVLGPDMHGYAEEVVALLHDRARLESMRQAARDAAGRHSIEAMANNFARGVRECLRRQ